MPSSAELKDRARRHIEGRRDVLIGVSHAIHAQPELAYEEHVASTLLADTIATEGLDVERGAFGLPTSFAARAGHRGPHVVVCCEYDALPGIGHACGHNVIAAAGLGAGLALSALCADGGGRVTILGTPAEEGGGGKVKLLERGAFADADVAMMVHPAEGDVEWAPHLANVTFDFEMFGAPAHASASPWKGINALDAVVLGYQAAAALRQHLRAGERVHGIITHGGDVPNVVPAYASARFRARAKDEVDRLALEERLVACFEGAARQTGCRLEVHRSEPYAELLWNKPLSSAYRTNGEALGRRFFDPTRIPLSVAGSTDMGNVSHAVPSIHPMIQVSPPHITTHQAEFAVCAASPDADRAIIDGAVALACTAIDVWTDAALLDAARRDHAASHERIATKRARRSGASGEGGPDATGMA